jgi:F420-dependent oxidoreductase-like protein
MQISARAPAMTAMTALTMAAISNDRFILGLGVSGPQVVEGLHNHAYKGSLTRLKETVDIVKLAFAGERLQYDGKYHQLPLPGGEGKALRLSQPGNPQIPIYLATIGPKALEYTGEVAEGWLGTSFTPEHAEAHLSYLRAGAQRAGRRLEDLDVQVGGTVAFGDDIQALMAARKPGIAFSLGAMGSARTNFYNDAFRRGGWDEASRKVQQLWLSGKREEACAQVPDKMVLQTNLLGDDDAVRERIRAYKKAGVTTLRLAPEGATLDERLETLGRAMDLVRAVDAE